MSAVTRHSPRVLTPPFDAAARAVLAEALAGGRVMAYPTETFYALGGNALHAGLVERIFALKQRAGDKALLLLVTPALLPRCVRNAPPGARALMEAFWPGPLTLVLHAAAALPAHVQDARGTVAVRCSPHPVVAELLASGGVPLIGTSANISGQLPARTAAEVTAAFAGAIDVLVDGGATAGGAPSTLVDTTVRPFRVLRAGAAPAAAIRACLLARHPLDAPATPDTFVADLAAATRSTP